VKLPAYYFTNFVKSEKKFCEFAKFVRQWGQLFFFDFAKLKLLKDLQQVAELLFFLLGILILVALALLSNNLFALEVEYFLRLVDIPFALICLIFAGTSFRLSLKDPDNHTKLKEAPLVDAFLVILGLALLAIVLIINLALPDLR
jgi:hypothetical protein